MDHLTEDQRSALLDGALGAREREAAERHLAGCAACREALAALRAQDEALAKALDHDPGDTYFDTFADRVEERLRAESLGGAQRRALEASRLGAWFRSPRALAWMGSIAAVVVAAGVVFVTSREVRYPGLRQSPAVEQAERAAGRADRGPAAPEPAPSAASREQGVEAGKKAGPSTVLMKTEAGAPAADQERASGVAGNREGRDAAERVDRRTLSAPPPASANQALATPPPTSANPALAAPPANMREVRRGPNGEDIPVTRPGERIFAPPPAAPPVAAGPPGQPVHIRKQNIIAPMGAAPRTEEKAQEKAKDNRAQELRDLDESRGLNKQSLQNPGARGAAGGQAPSPSDLAAQAQLGGSVRACGRVTDPAGRPVSGAVVVANGPMNGFTAADGSFCLDHAPGARQLTVMAVGYGVGHAVINPVEPAQVEVQLKPVSVIGAGVARSGAGWGNVKSLYRGGPQDQLSLKSEPAVAPDPFATLPDSLRAIAANARMIAGTADQTRSAAVHDVAAEEWGRLAAALEDGFPRDQARFEQASERFAAWRLEPTSPARRERTGAAIHAVLGGRVTQDQKGTLEGWLKTIGK